MNWITGIQNAIEYIENNLTGELTYTDIASKAFTSPFYFQRVFDLWNRRCVSWDCYYGCTQCSANSCPHMGHL